jgi:hypothetical protein
MEREALQCAANNVDWYEAVFRTHGLSGAMARGVWTCPGRPPPYYSNAVTLAPGDPREQIDELRRLGTLLGRSFSLKDSFAALDLAPLGFRPLFDAQWIRLDPASRVARDPAGAVLTWRRITTAPDLERWQEAWRANGSPCDEPVFLPGLLSDPNVVLFGSWRGDEVVAGCAANRSPEVVGLTNLFVADRHDEAFLPSAVAEVSRFAGPLPVVGYERGEALQASLRLGFRTVGPLRVWIRD